VRTTPKVEALAEKYQQQTQHSGSPCESRNDDSKGLEAGQAKDVRFYSMPLTPETAPMIKFGVQNTPIFILLGERWCETVLGADLRRVEGLIRGWVG
jgi:hypothetical protein